MSDSHTTAFAAPARGRAECEVLAAPAVTTSPVGRLSHLAPSPDPLFERLRRPTTATTSTTGGVKNQLFTPLSHSASPTR